MLIVLTGLTGLTVLTEPTLPTEGGCCSGLGGGLTDADRVSVLEQDAAREPLFILGRGGLSLAESRAGTSHSL